MNIKLTKIEATISEMNESNHLKLIHLQSQAEIEFAKLMSKKTVNWQKILVAVENSTELTQTEHDEYPSQWVRADFSTLIDVSSEFERDLLKQWFLSNHCVSIDFQNDCANYSIGPCILVNHDGDILDQESGEWVISKNDYESKEERNALIEAHMEKTGCFPNTIQADYYGNMSYIKTQA